MSDPSQNSTTRWHVVRLMPDGGRFVDSVWLYEAVAQAMADSLNARHSRYVVERVEPEMENHHVTT